MRINFRFKKKNKKGNAFLDMMLVILVLVGMSILGFISYNMLSDLNDDIQADPDINANVKAQSSNLQSGFPTWMDNAFLLVTVLMWVFIIVSSFVIDTHPAFFIVTLILLLFGFVVVIMLSNSFEEIAADDDFVGLSSKFPITYWIMTHLLFIAIIMGGSVLITLYGKNKFVGGT